MTDQPLETDGAWIFLSHSHKDLAKVRQIRDELERKGHNPLIFFLKCLEDDGSQLPELLRREIEARTWFILCDSPNARASKWVQEEVQVIKSLQGKVFQTVDLSEGIQGELIKVAGLAKRATVYLSYSRHDSHAADTIREALLAADFRVLQNAVTNALLAPSFEDAMRPVLDEALSKGFVLLLLSPTALTREFVMAEIEYAVHRARRLGRSNVVPVLIKDAGSVLSLAPEGLRTLQYLDLTSGDFRDQVAGLIRDLKARTME